MVNSKSSARSELEKLVRYFEANIHQLKASSFNEAQARQQLIDPFFEALGWDVRNKLMVPPYRVEVIPEGRVRSSLGKVVKDQAGLFDKSTALKEEQADYASMLEYIAEDELKAEEKAATKKPDYRFRIQGSTKFFVEAKRPSADLINKLDPIFQVKRYGFSARVPISILTDFEEFRVFDCTRKPFYDKPKVGVLKEFDLTYKSYLDDFDKLYSTFCREAVGAGSIEALQKKYLEKRTGEFALDRSFLEDLSQWRVELAQDIAKHPKNRRILNTYTLNEYVQRILDRIVFLRVCEDRNIEVERTLVELIRLWQDHEGISLYEKLNELIKQRRSLYNGLLFAEHECEQLEVSNKMLEKIFKNINYPLSPYHFDEIGVEILGSIYERFLGKTILFAITHNHAMRLAETFNEMYPEYGGKLVQVIDSKMERARDLLDTFKKQDMPRIAISVDMLDTGVDIPEVVNLSFMKPVNSQIKFWQMIGRGTRSLAACKNLDWLPNRQKEFFLIVDFWENFEHFNMMPKDEGGNGQVLVLVMNLNPNPEELLALG